MTTNPPSATAAEIERIIRLAMQDEFLLGRNDPDRITKRYAVANAAAVKIAAALSPPSAPGDVGARRVPTSREVMEWGGVDPDAPFEVGPFPMEMRSAQWELKDDDVEALVSDLLTEPKWGSDEPENIPEWRNGFNAAREHFRPLAAEVEALRGALEPFVIAETEFQDLPDDHPISVHTTAYPVREIMLTLGDFRHARSAFTSPDGGRNG